MSTDNQVGIHTPSDVGVTLVGGVEVQPSIKPSLEPYPKTDADPAQSTSPNAAADDKALAVMLALCGIFAGALALYVFRPAISTLFGLS